MTLDNRKFIATCESVENEVKCILSEIEPVKKGMLNSELLGIVGIMEVLDIHTVVESGRGRGYSSVVLSRFCDKRGVGRIISIELRRFSFDNLIALWRMYKYDVIRLESVYGDASKILPSVIRSSDQRVGVIIDGPKGLEAVRLALKCLESESVSFTVIHDVYKGTEARQLLETAFSEHAFFTDCPSFVREFSHLDEECWKAADSGMSPYVRHGKPIPSYGFTSAILVSEPERRLFSDSDYPQGQATWGIRRLASGALRRLRWLSEGLVVAPAVLLFEWLVRLQRRQERDSY